MFYMHLKLTSELQQFLIYRCWWYRSLLQQTLQVFDYAKTGLIILIIIVVVVLIIYVSTKSREALMK